MKSTSLYSVSLIFAIITTITHAVEEVNFCDNTNEGSKCQKSHYSAVVRLKAKKIGDEETLVINGKDYVLRTLSLKPVLFEIPDFLTTAECDHFIKVAKKKGLKKSVTYRHGSSKEIVLRDIDKDRRLSIDEMMLTLEDSFDMYFTKQDILQMYEKLHMDQNGDNFITPDEMNTVNQGVFKHYLEDFVEKYPYKRSRYSKQIWLFADTVEDDIFQNIQDRVQKLTKLHPAFIKKSDFQVVNYKKKGHYNAHHDSGPYDKNIQCCTRKTTKKCRICRFMTILFYLNDVEKGGETAFPLAGNETYDGNKFVQEHQQNLMQHCDKANVKVPPNKGKAVLWYNHFINDKTKWVGDLDPFTWHGGCPVYKGEKWIANFWVKYTDSVEDTLKI